MPEVKVMADFMFSKKIPNIIKNIMIKEYLNLRSIACDRLNGNFEEWNSEYSGTMPGEDLWSIQAKEYNEYIRSKEEPILEQINREANTILTEIHADEVGDLIAVCKYAKNLTMTVEITPI